MNNKGLLALIVFHISLLSGCELLIIMPATTILAGAEVGLGIRDYRAKPAQPFIPEEETNSYKLQSVQTIVLLEIPDPPNYGKDTLQFREFSFGNNAQAFLKQFLQENNYDVIEYAPYRENKYRLVDDYSLLNLTFADAYLDVAPVEVEYKQKDLSQPL